MANICKCVPQWFINMLPPGCAGCKSDGVICGVNFYQRFIAYPCGANAKHAHVFNFMCHTEECVSLCYDYLQKSGRILLMDMADNATDFSAKTITQRHKITGRQCAYCSTAKQSHCKFGNCSGCMCVKYCNDECKNNDWKRHKTQCVGLFIKIITWKRC